MKKLTRRSFLSGAAATAGVVAASGALAACGGSNNNSNEEKKEEGASTTVNTDEKIPMTIGYWGGNCCELAVYVAIENKCFEEAGIEPKVVTITADTSELLANDEIDFFLFTPGFFLSFLQGANAKLIDTMHTGCWSGITLEGNGIDNCADLAGKKVGCTGMSGPSYVESNSLCKRQGGDPSKIDWVVYDGTLLLQALKDGEVDAIIGIDSTLYPQVRDTKGAKFFFISAQELSDYYCCFVCCNTHTLEKYSDAGDKLALAFAKADDILRADVDAAVEMAIEKGYTVGKYPDIEKGLANNYLYGHGNKDDFTASIKERWQELYDAGFLEDAPKDESEVDAYLDELTEAISEWHGDVGADTAAKPLSEQVATRGDAFGKDPEEVRNTKKSSK